MKQMTKDDFANLCAVMRQAADEGSTAEDISAEFGVTLKEAEKVIAEAHLSRLRRASRAA